MKIRTPDCECIIVGDDGVTIIRATGPTTYHAIKKLRQLIDALIAEEAVCKSTP
jgi:hypothetical protein